MENRVFSSGVWISLLASTSRVQIECGGQRVFGLEAPRLFTSAYLVTRRDSRWRPLCSATPCITDFRPRYRSRCICGLEDAPYPPRVYRDRRSFVWRRL